MNVQTVSEQIIQVIEYIGQKFGIAINWTADNVLPVIEMLCKKYITWEIATSVAWIALCLIPIVVAICWAKSYIKRTDPDDLWDWDYDPEPFFITVIAVIACFALAPITTQIFDIIKCICFPELKIFEYAKQFIN